MRKNHPTPIHTKDVKILSMNWKSDTNIRAFEALLAGTKKIEIRTNNPYDKLDYSLIKEGDFIEFSVWQKSDARIIKAKVKRKSFYKDLTSLFEKEDVTIAVSSTNNIDEAISSINKLTGYKEAILKNGVYAIELIDVTLSDTSITT